MEQAYQYNIVTQVCVCCSVYAALCANSRVAQSLVSGPLLLCSMFAPSPQRSQWLVPESKSSASLSFL